jgi:hypothetical protein
VKQCDVWSHLPEVLATLKREGNHTDLLQVNIRTAYYLIGSSVPALVHLSREEAPTSCPPPMNLDQGLRQ